MKIVVLGSGAGGLAIAARAALKSNEVVLSDHDSFQVNIDAVIRNGGITCRLDDQITFSKVAGSKDISNALNGAELIFIVTPAFGTKPMAHLCKPYLQKGQKYIICPGSGGGALEFMRELGLDYFEENDIVVGETHTLPYAARVVNPGDVQIYHEVKTLIVSSLPPAGNLDLSILLQEIFGDIVQQSSSVFETILLDGNPVIHPAVMILNAALIQRTKGLFEFYSEGITDAVADLMEAVDKERIALGACLGIDIPSEPSMSFKEGYITSNINYREGYKQSEGFQGIMAPNQLEHRYLIEDVGYVMKFWKGIGTLFEINMPATEAIITITDIILGENVSNYGTRTVESLELTKEKIMKLI